MDLPSHEYLDWTQCVYCKHLGEPKTDGVPRPTCKAFPDGVPDDIVTNKFDHRNPYEGDNGVTFERDDEES